MATRGELGKSILNNTKYLQGTLLSALFSLHFLALLNKGNSTSAGPHPTDLNTHWGHTALAKGHVKDQQDLRLGTPRAVLFVVNAML